MAAGLGKFWFVFHFTPTPTLPLSGEGELQDPAT